MVINLFLCKLYRVDNMDKYINVGRILRKVTTSVKKNSHHVQIPDEIYQMICTDFTKDNVGEHINFLIVKNGKDRQSSGVTLRYR